MFANLYAELIFFCLTTLTPVSVHLLRQNQKKFELSLENRVLMKKIQEPFVAFDSVWRLTWAVERGGDLATRGASRMCWFKRSKMWHSRTLQFSHSSSDIRDRKNHHFWSPPPNPGGCQRYGSWWKKFNNRLCIWLGCSILKQKSCHKAFAPTL